MNGSVYMYILDGAVLKWAAKVVVLMCIDLFVPIRRLLFPESTLAIRSFEKDDIRQVF
jgi:hypothetical protein